MLLHGTVALAEGFWPPLRESLTAVLTDGLSALFGGPFENLAVGVAFPLSGRTRSSSRVERVRRGSCNTSSSSNPGSDGRHIRSSFVFCPMCPRDKRGAAEEMSGPLPVCLLKNGNCTDPQDKAQSRKYIRAIDKAREKKLQAVATWKQRYLRRVCDWQIAEKKGLGSIAKSYGPHGPMRPVGSYGYALRRYISNLQALMDECASGASCSTMLQLLRTHPDMAPKSGSPKALSQAFFTYQTFRDACDLGKKRNPIPNMEKAWCDTDPDGFEVCEFESCAAWWNKFYGASGRKFQDGNLQPMYRSLEGFCKLVESVATEKKHKTLSEIFNQKRAVSLVQEREQQLCGPASLQGFCEDETTAGTIREDKCTFANGNYCPKGRVLPKAMTYDESISDMMSERQAADAADKRG